MTGDERLVLSGGVVTDAFFEQAFQLATADDPQVLVDLSAAPDLQTYQEKRDVYYNYLSKVCTRRPNFMQDQSGRPKSNRAISQLLRHADILFVGGGSTRQLLERWSDYTKQAVTERVAAGELVGTGVSAGALLWFEQGHSDTRQYEVQGRQTWRYIMLPGLDTIHAAATVHHGDHDSMGRLRSQAFRQRLKYSEGWQQAVGLNSTAALLCSDGVFRVLAMRGKRKIYEPDPAITLYRPEQAPVMYGDGETVPLV